MQLLRAIHHLNNINDWSQLTCSLAFLLHFNTASKDNYLSTPYVTLTVSPPASVNFLLTHRITKLL